MPEKKYIRFINSHYKNLFHLPDGGRIRITYLDGKQCDRVCRFLDEYHTNVGGYHYHICEFAERMEQLGAKYEPLDYITDLDFYNKVFLANCRDGKRPPYYVVDETETLALAYAPNGPKGRRYCIFEKEDNAYRSYSVGGIVRYSGSLRDLRPQDYGFDMAKIKAVCKKPKTRTNPER